MPRLAPKGRNDSHDDALFCCAPDTQSVLVRTMNGNQVAQWMKRNSVRPEVLAAELGISRGTLYRLTSGQQPVSKHMAIALEQVTKKLTGDSKKRGENETSL